MMETETSTPVSDIVMFKSGGSTATGDKVETPAATPAENRDEAGRFKAKEEAKAEPVTEVKTEAKAEVKPEPKVEKPQGQLAALMAERAKRQALEQELASLRAGKAEAPDIFTEPEKAVKSLVEQQVAPIRQKFFMQSIEVAQSRYADFEAAAENAAKLMDSNKALEQELRAADDPGEFIYQLGSNTPEFRQARDAKHREEMSTKDARIAALEAEVNALKGAKQAQSEVPESLNRQPSGAVPARDGDAMDIKNIVRFKSG